MTNGPMQGTVSRIARIFGILGVAAALSFAGKRAVADDAPKPWVAPDDAKAVKSPLQPTPENLSAGEQTFTDNCVLCHGEKGAGDGLGAKAIKVKPADFTDKKLMGAETDGAIFWKMSEGRGPMPAWKEVLTDKERWQLVLYIRKLGKDATK